ncbi:hypothetical protein J7F03_20800 [Streptomyces sp. ISL-43]|uniref:hypothetical protein n=1 Tax=Streptomyces sp. ISL-43 TaxID=2819183 RepID=UPI001BED2739|nr:hypothetical protein [Streptomyces sp. ISL-43]MBT2449483.1 hypothetical protein [Streptomyces sp. ISL-43]
MTVPKTRQAPDSFDAYWAEVSGARTETIRGITVRVPVDVPMVLEQRMADLQDSEQEEDIAELVAFLFNVGPDTLSTWRQKGMGLTEFQVVLAWGLAHASGSDLTFAQAHELVKKAEAEGKAQAAAPNRAARRASSASTGGRSKPTSGRATASPRKVSRG